MIKCELEKHTVDKSINYQWLSEEDGIAHGYAILLKRDYFMTKVCFKVFKAKKTAGKVKYTGILKLVSKNTGREVKEFHVKRNSVQEVTDIKEFLENYSITSDEAVLSTLVKEIQKG